MKIAVELAGFDWTGADRLRKAIGKKDDELMASMQTQFVDGCAHGGIPQETAEELWDQIQYFGGYGFCKAHAVGYAVHTYETASLKVHYPREYFASLLSVAEEDSKKKDKRKRYIADARRRGIEVRPSDINASTDRYAIIDDAICLPLIAVTQVGPVACEAIVTAREDGDFESYADFCDRIPKSKVDKRAKANLIKAGAFDSLRPRGELLEQLEIANPDVLALEHEVLGIYVSGHPLDSFPYDDGTIRISEISDLPIGSEFKTVGIVASFRTLLAEAGLRDVTLHTLRHTFASQLVMAGVPLREVQELMGHQSFQTTSRYAHLSEDHVKKQVLRLPFANG